MSIGYVGKAFFITSTSGTSCPVPMPSTAAAGNKLYCLIGSIGANSGSVTPPSGGGWSLVKELLTGSSLRGQLYVKTAVSGDTGATHTWTFPSAGRMFGYSLAYSGVDVAASELVDATGTTTAGAGPWATPALGVGDNDWLLTAAIGRENPGTATTKNWTTSDGSDLERFDLASAAEPSINITAALYDSGRALTAGSPSRNLTSSVSLTNSQVWAVRIPALADAPPASTNPWTVMGMPLR